MPEAQGPNIAEWQAQQQHRENQGGKNGFGLGYGDSIATIVDGMKWLFNFHEGAIPAYCNVFEGLINGSNLVTLFGKSGNMFGIKFLEGLAEYFSYGEGIENVQSRVMDTGRDYGESNQDDYPHASNEIIHNAGGLHNMYGIDNYHDQSFLPGSSISVGNVYRRDLDI